jgi:hypothetical protein
MHVILGGRLVRSMLFSPRPYARSIRNTLRSKARASVAQSLAAKKKPSLIAAGLASSLDGYTGIPPLGRRRGTGGRYRSSGELADLVNDAMRHACAGNDAVTSQTPQEMRVLLLMPEYFGGSKTRNDLLSGFEMSARSAGLQVKSFPTDELTYTESRSVSNEAIEEMLERIASYGPDLVIGEGNFAGTSTGIGIEFYSRVRSSTGAGTAIVLPDNWGGEFQKFWPYWAQAADLLLYFQANSPLVDQGHDRDKIHLMPVPIDPTIFHPHAKNHDVSFQGTLYGSRPINLTHVSNTVAAKGGTAILIAHTNFNSPTTSTQDDLALTMRSGRSCVNFTWRSTKEHCLNGRSFQATASGCTLIQEEPHNSEILKTYFQPYLEYIPFSCKSELKAAVEFIFDFPELSDAIGARAALASETRWGPGAIWSQLQNKVTSQRAKKLT